MCAAGRAEDLAAVLSTIQEFVWPAAVLLFAAVVAVRGTQARVPCAPSHALRQPRARRADGCKGQQPPRECAVHTVHCQYPVPKLLQGSAGNRSTLAFPPPSFMTFASRATSTMGASLRLKHSNKPSLITRHSHCRVSPSPSQLSSSHHAGAC